MKASEIYAQIEKAIDARPGSKSGKWYVTWKNDRFVCVAIDVAPRPVLVLAELSQEDVTKGLSSKQWNQLFGKCLRFLEEAGKWSPPQEQSKPRKQANSSQSSSAPKS